VASLSQGRTAAAQCGLFTYKSVPVIFEPPCSYRRCKVACCRNFVIQQEKNVTLLCCCTLRGNVDKVAHSTELSVRMNQSTRLNTPEDKNRHHQ